MPKRTQRGSSKGKSENPKKYISLGHQKGTKDDDGEIVDDFYREWCKENELNPDTAGNAQFLDIIALNSSFRAKAQEVLSDEDYEAVMAGAKTDTFGEPSEDDADSEEDF